MRLRFFALFLCLPLLGLAPIRGAEPTLPRRLEGEIAGARWAALVPENWNGRVLFEAPDRRHAPAPLAAELDPTTPEHQALLSSGWVLATTSYRRTGLILVDAIDDLRALRDRLASELGQPQVTIVSGTGMGGLIAALMAERHSDEFHAFLARDPKLELRDPRALRLKCDYQPRGPLLILFGPATARGVIVYHERAHGTANAESVVPVLWYQPPPGEEDPAAAPVTFPAALEALAAWSLTREVPKDRLETLPALEELPATIAPPPETAAPVEAPLLPDEPPPMLPVDEAPAGK